MERTCKKCGETKSIEEFSKNTECKEGRRHTCKICSNFSNLKPLSQNKINKIDLLIRGLKKCCSCKNVKQTSEFYKAPSTDGYRGRCIICDKDMSKRWGEKNREKHRLSAKEYRINHLEQCKQTVRKYRKLHKEKCYELNMLWSNKNKKYVAEKKKITERLNRNNLKDTYMINIMMAVLNLSRKTLYQHPELIENYRQQIKVKRLLKQKKHENFETS
jgi:hypothetical protein